jgi:hypothetical protein
MKKTVSKKTKRGEIIVTISRFGQEPVNVTMATGSTVSDVLEAASISTTGREELFVEGETAESDDVLENGDILSIVTPKQAG